MNNTINIPTLTQVCPGLRVTTPVLSSLPPADWCRHNAVKHLCAFCSQWSYEPIKIIDCSGSTFLSPLQKSEGLKSETNGESAK